MSEPSPDWSGIIGFCLFVGYARSGHSAIGSMIDAHPNAAVSHELNAVKRYYAGVSRDELFTEIFQLSQRQAREGRHSSNPDGGTYTHTIDGQIKSDTRGVSVLGDKKGAGTTVQVANRGLDHILEQISGFQQFVGVPVKMLHVIRNPYDIVAAETAIGRNAFASLLEKAGAIRQACVGHDWLDVYYEAVLADPASELRKILDFLGLPIITEHIDACGEYLFAAPHSRRFETSWPASERSRVQQLIERYAFLERYSWEP